MKVKDLKFQKGTIKTHLAINGQDLGISGYFTSQELFDNFYDCDCEIVEYEKDYGEGAIAIRKYLRVDVYGADNVIRKLILKLREEKND